MQNGMRAVHFLQPPPANFDAVLCVDCVFICLLHASFVMLWQLWTYSTHVNLFLFITCAIIINSDYYFKKKLTLVFIGYKKRGAWALTWHGFFFFFIALLSFVLVMPQSFRNVSSSLRPRSFPSACKKRNKRRRDQKKSKLQQSSTEHCNAVLARMPSERLSFFPPIAATDLTV